MLQAPAVCGLFAGAGGFELGLKRAGFATSALCEINPAAQAVLRSQFPSAKLHADVLTPDRIPEVQVVTAGFPCQDLSVRGAKAGIDGSRSGLVKRMFDLLADARGAAPRWLALENVPNMLNTQNGAAMRLITGRLNDLGYRWAYRVVDARAFGLPQRRLRVILLASPVEDPCAALYADNALEEVNDSTRIADARLAYGFYWTEGQTGLGWVVNGVPTIKGGSTVGIPSPPAVWIRETGELGTPDIRDLERLQGLPEDWTVDGSSFKGARWSLVGNAICVEVAAWLGGRMMRPGSWTDNGSALRPGDRWPNAAHGGPGRPVTTANVTTWPVARPYQSLRSFLRHPLKPLSSRATRGYLNRVSKSKGICFPPGFLDSVRAHEAMMRGD